MLKRTTFRSLARQLGVHDRQLGRVAESLGIQRPGARHVRPLRDWEIAKITAAIEASSKIKRRPAEPTMIEGLPPPQFLEPRCTMLVDLDIGEPPLDRGAMLVSWIRAGAFAG